MQGTSNLFSLTTVPGDRKPYLQIDGVEGLWRLRRLPGSNFTLGIVDRAIRIVQAGSCSISIPPPTCR
jgi:hypothetical protein